MKAPLPASEALEKLKQLESSMTYEQFQEYKRTQMRPFRTRNLALAGALWAGVIAVYSFSMYKTSRDDFTKFDNDKPTSK